MSLKFFHILFITLSTLMCLVVAIWALDAYRVDGSSGWLALAGAAVAGGGVLVVYGTRFLQKARRLALGGLIAGGTLVRPADVLACTVCLGSTESSLRDGMNAGVLVLLGFALFMIVSFGAFAIYLWKRERRLAPVPGSGFPVPGSGSGFESGSGSGFTVPREGRSNA